MVYDLPPAARMAQADYSQWSIEELWQLASQLRVAGARSKSRAELIDLFATPASKGTRR
jgi:hypothetical protein